MGRLRPGQGGSCAPDAWVGPGGARQGAAFCAERSSRVDQLLDHLAFRTERRGRGASQPQRAAAPVRSTPYEDWQNTRATARQPPGLSTHPKTGDRKEHTSELQSLMRISYAVFCLKKKKINIQKNTTVHKQHN